MFNAYAKALGVTWPKVLGHEGAAIVDAVGDKVTEFKVGDRVLLSHNHSDQCPDCRGGQRTRCEISTQLNLGGDQGTFELVGDGTKASSCFFSQSSFAALSICKWDSCVVVTDLVSAEELKFLAPLGCGLMGWSGQRLH